MREFPFRSDRSRRTVSRKKKKCIIMNKQLFFQLFRKRFCRKTMQRAAGYPRGKTVTGKNTVIYLK